MELHWSCWGSIHTDLHSSCWGCCARKQGLRPVCSFSPWPPIWRVTWSMCTSPGCKHAIDSLGRTHPTATTAERVCRGGRNGIFRGGRRNSPCFSQLKMAICRGGHVSHLWKWFCRGGWVGVTHPWKSLCSDGWSPDPPLQKDFQVRVSPGPALEIVFLHAQNFWIHIFLRDLNSQFWSIRLIYVTSALLYIY